MFKRFWQFRNNKYKDAQNLFDCLYSEEIRPPVFSRENGYRNIILKEDMTEDIKKSILEQIPKGKWHKWYNSMTSSQALTQSVFGNLIVLKRLNVLAEINGDDGKPIFLRNFDYEKNCKLEYVVNYLGERRSTNIDVFFDENYRVAVECKLMEYEIGPCYAGRQKKECDDRYKSRIGEFERCLKTRAGAKYWEYIPLVFNWSANVDYNPCRILDTYQLVRNVLAACVRENGELQCDKGHAVLLYDNRNPEFKSGGQGFIAFQEVKDALKKPSLLQKCTWQQVLLSIRSYQELDWLSDLLFEKYGL